MAMTKREKLLASGIAGIGCLLGGQYAINSVRSGYEELQTQIDRTQDEIDDHEDMIFKGQLDGKKLADLKGKSLPTDPEEALATYVSWLTQVGRSVGIDGLSVDKKGRATTTDAYTAHAFELKGKCKTDQVVELLAKFYDKDYLHSISTLSMLPDARERDVFTLVIRAKALALNGAPKDAEPSEEPSGRLKMDVSEYKDVILARNPFSPPNRAPSIETKSTLEIVQGERWSERLEAKDEEGHDTSWELKGDVPEGLELNGGRLSFSPEKVGEYDVSVVAIDSGWPAMSSEKKIRLVVKPPEKKVAKVEPPKFDDATKAFASAIVQGAKGPQLCVRVMTKSETLWLSVGDDIDVGTVKAKLITINPRESYVEFESEERRWTLGMDESLSEAFQKSAID